MHAAAHAAVEADLAHEHLGEKPHEQEVLREAAPGLVGKARLHGAEQGAAAVGLHDRGERVVAQPRDRGQPLGQELPVRAVRPEHVIFGRQGHGRADRGRLLSDREMRRALVGIGQVAVPARGLEAGDAALEGPDDHHVAQRLDQRVRAARPDLLAQGPRIGMNGDPP